MFNFKLNQTLFDIVLDSYFQFMCELVKYGHSYVDVGPSAEPMFDTNVREYDEVESEFASKGL